MIHDPDWISPLGGNEGSFRVRLKKKSSGKLSSLPISFRGDLRIYWDFRGSIRIPPDYFQKLTLLINAAHESTSISLFSDRARGGPGENPPASVHSVAPTAQLLPFLVFLGPSQ
jgi:hypothetical protein